MNHLTMNNETVMVYDDKKVITSKLLSNQNTNNYNIIYIKIMIQQ